MTKNPTIEIEQAGTYTLIITTSESEEIPLVGGIGHVPDSTWHEIFHWWCNR